MMGCTPLRIAVLLVGLMVAASAGAIDISVRDSLTGKALDAQLHLSRKDGTPSRSFSLAGATTRITPGAGRWQAQVEAMDHRPLTFELDAASSAITVLLDPYAVPESYRRLDALAAAQPDARWLQGHVRRALDATAVADALTEFDGHHTRSDSDGYFELPLDPWQSAQPANIGLTVRARGFAEYQREGFVRAAGVQRVLVVLGGDTPAHARIEVGALDRSMALPRTDEPMLEASPPRTRLPPGDALLALPLAPPSSIRVGYADAACTTSCCTGSCNFTCVLPLETYVRRGLDSEWIASWNTQSLRAGSLAYRSYGAWRVAHPINANFDICSSACCQVNDAGTHSSTDNAIARTPGLMLTRNGSEAASSEYSAENNSWDDPNDGLSCSNVDLSCGDGYAGSPSTGWPCLPDSVGAGHGCFGHGRGMSQWGTQRWAIHASAPRWPWIVDHYYNDNNNEKGAGSGQRTALMTSPVSLSGLFVSPTSIEAGESIQLGANASNAAGAAHAHLLIGASLYQSGQGYVDDSSHDLPLNLAPGSQAITRSFDTPGSLASGSWDVLLSLYLDVDENGAISALDVPMALLRVNGALQVIDDRIFAHGFEP